MATNRNQRPTSYYKIPRGKRGTKATLAIMRKVIRQARQNPVIREKALSIVSHLTQKDFLGEVKAIHRFVRDHIRYVRDVRSVETLQWPWTTLDIGQGDCDDKAMLASALLESIGHRTRIVAVGLNGLSFCHVLLETQIGRKWVPVETTEPVELGWYPPKANMRMVRYV